MIKGMKIYYLASFDPYANVWVSMVWFYKVKKAINQGS